MLLADTQLPGAVVAAMDINTVANAVYTHNHPKTPVLNNNIQKLTIQKVNKLGINMVLMSPPCQPFTRVGNQLDMNDSRTDALKHLCWLLPQCSNIDYILMENVKGFETSRARDNYIEAIKNAGFHVREFILSPTKFGVPNTRYRYYCLARRKNDFNFENDKIWFTLPHEENHEFKEISTVQQVLQDEFESLKDFYLDDKVLNKRAWLLDIVTPASKNTICFTKAYTHYSEGTGSILSASNPRVIAETFERVKQLQGVESDESLTLLKNLKLRYFTPREVARLMSFPETFSFPDVTTTRQQYRLLGNSINILVVGELIKLLCSTN